MTGDDSGGDDSTRTDIPRPPAELIQQALPYASATLHEAIGRRGALPAAIKPLRSDFRVCGPAVTVSAAPNDNIWLHRALYLAAPGDVLVVDVGGASEAGYWGEVMATSAIARGLGGLVIDGCVRDGNRLREMGWPVFARGLCIRGTEKNRDAPGAINAPLSLGDVAVAPGDLVAGDGDGVVVIPREALPAALERAAARERKEARLMQELAAGKRTLDLFGLE